MTFKGVSASKYEEGEGIFCARFHGFESGGVDVGEGGRLCSFFTK